MNYSKHYNNLIEKARARILKGYVERHHVIPKCMGGTNNKDNLVNLTPEEHYVAHQLLTKIFPGNTKLIFAMHKMNQGRPGNKLYGWIRRSHAKAMSDRVVSEDTRKKLSEANKGSNNPMYGKESPSGMKGKNHTLESKIKQSKSGYLAWDNIERRKEMSEKFSGINHPLFGKKASIETKQKLSKQRRGKLNSMYGKSAIKGSKWMNKNGEIRFVKNVDIENHLKSGWNFGRKF